MLQDTAARARPSGLACHRVLRLSGKIMQMRTSLVWRLRPRLFFVVVTCFGRQMCKIREGPCAASKPFLPPQEKSDVDFSKMAAGWTQCSPASHSHGWNHGGKLWRRSCTGRMRPRSTKQCSDTTRWSTRLRPLTGGRCFQLHGLELRAKSYWVFDRNHGRLQSETDHGCPVGACAGANVKDSQASVGHEKWRGAEVRGWCTRTRGGDEWTDGLCYLVEPSCRVEEVTLGWKSLPMPRAM